jgi:hypothetical protein
VLECAFHKSRFPGPSFALDPQEPAVLVVVLRVAPNEVLLFLEQPAAGVDMGWIDAVAAGVHVAKFERLYEEFNLVFL